MADKFLRVCFDAVAAAAVVVVYGCGSGDDKCACKQDRNDKGFKDRRFLPAKKEVDGDDDDKLLKLFPDAILRLSNNYVKITNAKQYAEAVT